MSIWNETTIPVLKRLHASGLTYTRISQHFGVSRGAIAGAVRRHIHGLWETAEERQARNVRRKEARGRVSRRLARQPRAWTEEALTEPYAMRKLRLAAERRAA